jgi:hypothetical protein
MPPKDKANIAKDKFLGMPTGTAANRLRKQILFRCIQKLGEDLCYRCKERISSVRDLSIEHIKPWLNVDVALFWDLDNIAYSHLSCNVAAGDKVKWRTAGTNAQRRIGPEGTAWCSSHRAFLPICQFNRNLSHWNGVSNDCRECGNVPGRRGR